MNGLTRNEQIVAVIAFLALMAALVFATWFSPVAAPKPVAQAGGIIGALDVGTPGIMTNTPVATATIPPTPTALSSSLGVQQGGIRAGYISYSSGTGVIHGLGAVPKACAFQFISSTAITVTAFVSSTTAFTLTAAGASNTPMYWICSQ